MTKAKRDEIPKIELKKKNNFERTKATLTTFQKPNDILAQMTRQML